MIGCARKNNGFLRRSEFVKLTSFVMLIFSAWFPAFSQGSKLDSLKALMRESNGNQKIHLLFQIAKILPYDEAADQYRRIIDQTSDSIVLARAIYNLGACLFNQRRFHEAEALVETNIPLFEKNEAAGYYLEGMYSTYAKIQKLKGNYSSSFENFYKCLALVRSRDDSLMLGSLFINIGLLYYKVRNNTKALELYSKGLSLIRNERGIEFMGNMNLSLCLSELDFPSRALSYCDKAFTLANDQVSLLHAEFATGFVLLKLGRLEEARGMFECSLKRSSELNDYRMQADNLTYISKIWEAEAMLDSTNHALSHAENIASENQLKEILLDVYRGFIRIAFERNQFDRLTVYQQRYIQLKGDVYNMELEHAQASLQGDWYERQNQQIIDLQQLELEERHSAMVDQKWISLTLYIIVLLLIIIIVLYLRGFYLQQKSKKILESQVYGCVGQLNQVDHSKFFRDIESRSRVAHELNNVLEQCGRRLINLLKGTPQLLLDESLTRWVAKLDTDNVGRSILLPGPSELIHTENDARKTK